MKSKSVQLKIVSALIYPWHVGGIEKDLLENSVTGVTVSEARAFGGYTGEQTVWGTKIMEHDRIQMDVVVKAEQVEEVVTIFKKQIMEEKGVIGTCLIAVSPLEKAVRIRTGKEEI
ncbi:MAG: P-II family nitrogen regulator [Candidatus Scalinduaceae bacterium]